MKIEDPNTGKLVSAIRRTYKLKMKAGTTGTLQDPHRPEVRDLIEGMPGDWSINQAEETVTVDCPENVHDIISQTHQRDNG